MNEAPQIISQSKFEESDYSIIKIMLLALASIGTGFAAVYELHQFLLTFQYAFLWFSLGALLAFLVFNILSIFLVKHFSIIWGIALVETFAPLALFLKYAQTDAMVYLLIAFGVMFLAISVAARQGMNVLKNSVKIRFFEVARSVTPKLMSGILVAACTLIYAVYIAWGGFNAAVGHKLVGETLRGAEPVVKVWFPQVSVNQTVDQMLRAVVTAQIEKLPPGAIPNVPFDLKSGLAQLSPADRETVLSKFTSGLKQDIEAKVGAFQEGETVQNAAYRLLDEYIKNLPPVTRQLEIIGFMLFVFFSLRSLAALAYWFVNFLAFAIFKFILAADIALVTYETRSREFVILP